ncbi:galactose oxidase [Nitzschia inconspicua]|uniref:Galactose oxidase n=1 Tax=Nitzschia inconspicua TaxID=303405 RepID=A0A9K3LGM4_9STRA|nr:galactose oxidase [Nitzschia inconspicua]
MMWRSFTSAVKNNDSSFHKRSFHQNVRRVGSTVKHFYPSHHSLILLPSIVYLTMTVLMTTILLPTSLAWSTEWINLENGIGSSSSFQRIMPPRSGHVAFHLDDKIFVFGGYAAEQDEQEKGVENRRYPINDLWVLDPTTKKSDQGWTRLHGADEANTETASIPQQRLAAAAVTCQNKEGAVVGLVLGGWDSQEAGTGGVILQDLQAYCPSQNTWQKLSFDLQQPTSRLCAVTLTTTDPKKVLVHNHRCTDHVLILDMEKESSSSSSSSPLTRQPTTGSPPSPRGLHACVLLPNTTKMVLFGGAAQDGSMSNEVFVLDTETWEWQAIEAVDNKELEEGEDRRPSPRASPCLVAIDESTCVLFGGATRSEQGLHGCSDTWLLELVVGDDDSDNDDCSRVRWTKLNDDGCPDAPPGRNAASLTRLSFRPAILEGKEVDASVISDQYFVLSGGWYPFRTTYNDNYVLKVTKG